MLGLGLAGYFSVKFNIFDCVIVAFSLVEIGFEIASSDALGAGLSALRTFRLMRVFKLAKSWEDLNKLLTTIAMSILEVANASVVLLIIMFIFVLLGMQLFGGVYDEAFSPDEKPRAHFDNFWWAFVTVFQVLTGENWNEVLYNTMFAAGPGAAVIYFVALNVVGNYLILNLFLAILLGNFEQDDDGESNADNGKSEDASGDKASAKQPTNDVVTDSSAAPGTQNTSAPAAIRKPL